MRTQDEIQSDIRELRREFDASNKKGTKKAGEKAYDDSRLEKRRAEILIKIKQCSQEFMAVIKANQS
jgi:hypothetical protein